MSDTVIKVENLSKKYILSHQRQEKYTALRDVMTNGVKNLSMKLIKSFNRQVTNHNLQSMTEEFFALKDVSFEIKQGDRVGIIGRNGAGKSTLLKILSRITEPTSGRIEIAGRVASLLEVGTGFHPELTGRENIFLNGAILGMGKSEIKRKFDEIVDFAEVEKFLDTPVKRYSSGMYVRLAFAVAANLEPEILIVDEVLAVGDAQFQKKCLGKMEEVGKNGRTVLFVSHNMAAVQNLCSKGMMLKNGSKIFYGSQTEAISGYLSSINDCDHLENRSDRKGSGLIRITRITLQDQFGHEIDTLMSGQGVDILLHFKIRPGITTRRAIASIQLRTSLDIPVFLQHNRMTADDFGLIANDGSFCCHITKLPLPQATYHLDYAIFEDGEYLDALTNASEITVVDGKYFNSAEVPPASHGICLVDAKWTLK
jgi:lipopolysaccharide transport system ATP-binding protein